MTTITYPQPNLTATAGHSVYVRTHHGAGWTAVADLHCRRLSLATGESLSSAELYWRFGAVLKTGAVTFTTKAVRSITPRTYVRVVCTATAGGTAYDWVGVWTRPTKAEKHQSFQAVGIESLLDQPIRDTPWVDADGAIHWAGCGLEFDRDGVANRSADKYTVNGRQVYVWEPDTGVAEYWSTQDAVATLLACAAPKDENGDVIFAWGLDGRDNLPTWDQVRLPTHGRSAISLLRSLIPRSRLTGWTCDYDSAADVPAIRVFTFADTAQLVYDYTTGDLVGAIPDNDTPIDLDVSADQSAADTLSIDASHVCDQVAVSGDRREIVCTVSKADESLDRWWTDGMEAAYLAGASNEPDYPPAEEIAAREQRDIDARNGEKNRPVFSWFQIPDDWDQTAGDGEDGEELTPIAVDDAAAQFLLPPDQIKIQDRLPLLTGYDIDAGIIAALAGSVGYHGLELDGVAHEQLPILVALRFYTADPAVPGDVDRWVFAHQLGRAAHLEPTDEGGNRRWSAAVRAFPPLATAAGIEIRVQGEPQHVLAATEFSSREDAVPGALDWASDLMATVCVLDTRRVEVRYPPDAALVSTPKQSGTQYGTPSTAPYGDWVQRLYVEAPGYRLVDVRPHTVVSISEVTGDLERSDGGYLIDDRPQMQLVAERLYAWHRVPRYSLQYQTGWITASVRIGQLVTAITDPSGTYPVNSVVTEITVEYPVAASEQAPRPRCSVVTAFGELDF